jgi:hypothetical protein
MSQQPQWQPTAPPPYQPPPPRRRRRVWPWVLLGVVVLFFGGCVAIANNVGNEIKEQSRPVMVTYEITSIGVVTAGNITYTKDVNLGMEQVGDAKLPWKKDVQFGEGFFKPLSISAQAGNGTGTITCRILVDGVEVAKSTSQGQFVIASCSGDVPKR